MKKLHISIILTALFAVINHSAFAASEYDDLINFTDQIIYGIDDRVDAQDYDDERFVKMSKSVAIRVFKGRLTPDRKNPDIVYFPNSTLMNQEPDICPDERFVEQVKLGDCSGFLIGPKTLVTAGHCMHSIDQCAGYKWVFNFKSDTTEFSSSQVYSCKKIISQKYVYSDKEIKDYAVIELDRKVEGASPLKIRKFGWVRPKTELVIIGHPSGLPMKISDGARVTGMDEEEKSTIKSRIKAFKLRRNYFTTNSDTYVGSSGSPVFNKKTGKVEGIIIQGAQDYQFNPKKECLESAWKDDSYGQEKVMKITKIPGI